MKLHCLTGTHSSDLRLVSNQGFHFSRCKSCGEDLIRSGARWKPVPTGFRVVWKPAMSARIAGPVLPVIVAEAPKGRRASSRAWLDHPAFIFPALALAGMRLLVRQGIDRVRPARRAARSIVPLALTYAPGLKASEAGISALAIGAAGKHR